MAGVLTHALDGIMASTLSASLKKLLAYRAVEVAVLGGLPRLPRAASADEVLGQHEQVLAALRGHIGGEATLGSAVQWLRDCGSPALANRLRAAARRRNATAAANCTPFGNGRMLRPSLRSRACPTSSVPPSPSPSSLPLSPH